MKLKKGSPEAKRYMANLRAAKGKSKPVGKAKAKAKVKAKSKTPVVSNTELKRRFELGKKQMLSDVKKKIVPSSVKSFQDLDLYVDANGYGGLTANSYNISKNYVFENKLQSMFDSFIKKGGLKSKNIKVGASPKKTIKKAAGPKMMHKDTKSHNVNIRVLSGIDSIDFTRVNNDVNGNPRYVIHFLDVLNAEERLTIPFTKKYEYAIKKAKVLGGKKYTNKSYGGGIVFQSYNIQNTEKKLIELKHTTPKIKY